MVDAAETGYNLTLSLDCKSLPKPGGKTYSINLSNYIEKDDKERKALIKKSEEEFFDKYSKDLSFFKRNFFASPFEMVFKKASISISYKKFSEKVAKLGPEDKVEYSPSNNEAVWIIPEGKE